jgi:hypothetical protein
MSEEYETTEHLTAEEISRSISIMCSQQESFVAQLGWLRAALARPLPRIEDCGDVPRNQQAIDRSYTDKIIVLLTGRDRDWIEGRIADLEEKLQSITGVIDKYRMLRSIKRQPDPRLSGLTEQLTFLNSWNHTK